MKRLLILAGCLLMLSAQAQHSTIDGEKIKEDLDGMLSTIENQYAYLSDKKVDMECIRSYYTQRISQLRNQADVILFYEYLLNEFYDSHISLTTNIPYSYRLSTTIYVEKAPKGYQIQNVWQSQLENLDKDILGAQILSFNGKDLEAYIDAFPSYCNDKTDPEVRTWIANKVIAGIYNQARILTLRLKNGQTIDFDLDQLRLREDEGLLTTSRMNGVGIIRINNSLGNNQLISAFDSALDELMDTTALIIDLRNTNNGGNTYVAKGIMGRFIDSELPYQKHDYIEAYDGQPGIVRSWLEMVSPRGEQYTKPVAILVGRWTGSMGEGMAVGFDGMKRAKIIGTEMKRLAGSDFNFQFYHQSFGYKMILQRLYHIDGTPRETYVPKYYVPQTNLKVDEALQQALKLVME